jgi:hypothetical protein
MSLTQYENLARDHWKEFLPKRYKELKKAGELEAGEPRHKPAIAKRASIDLILIHSVSPSRLSISLW